MKSNTLAVALAALLVGGVAIGAYHNSRDDNPAAAVGVAGGEAGKLDYAEVIGVVPVTEKTELFATVIGSEPVRETTTSTSPREVCDDVVVQERLPERDGNVGGTVAGAIIGGLVGSRVGDGNGRKVATAAGATAGGFIGNRMDRRHVGGQVVTRTDRQCRTVTDTAQSSRTVAYNVTYRNPDGTVGSMRTESRPGSRITRSATSSRPRIPARWITSAPSP